MSERPPMDDLEQQLACLQPVAPSADVMTRLRAARPKPAVPVSAPHPVAPLAGRRDRRRSFSLTAAAAVAVVAALAWLQLPAPEASRSATVAATPAPNRVAAAVAEAAQGAVAAGSIFLPIESSSHLVSLHPVPEAARPDEVARPLWRAVVVDDLTAVGAETDAALHVRRAREVFIPVARPVY
ncbi:MAG: hypothetical protein ACKV19_09125 [Verrucomicrobiales bacterium]